MLKFQCLIPGNNSKSEQFIDNVHKDVSLRDCWEENSMETSYGRQPCGKELY